MERCTGGVRGGSGETLCHAANMGNFSAYSILFEGLSLFARLKSQPQSGTPVHLLPGFFFALLFRLQGGLKVPVALRPTHAARHRRHFRHEVVAVRCSGRCYPSHGFLYGRKTETKGKTRNGKHLRGGLMLFSESLFKFDVACGIGQLVKLVK